MDIGALKELFDAKFDPLKDGIHDLKQDVNELRIDICELKKQGQSNSYEVNSCQLLHDQIIQDLKTDVVKCNECVGTMKDKSSKRLWDIITIMITGILGVFLGKHL